MQGLACGKFGLSSSQVPEFDAVNILSHTRLSHHPLQKYVWGVRVGNAYLDARENWMAELLQHSYDKHSNYRFSHFKEWVRNRLGGYQVGLVGTGISRHHVAAIPLLFCLCDNKKIMGFVMIDSGRAHVHGRR